MNDEMKTIEAFGFYYTTKQIAEIFGTHPSTILQWVKLGLPHKNHPDGRGAYRFDINDTAKWIEDHKKRHYLYFMNNYKKKED